MIHHGDCIEVMAGMEPESIDAIVTDPPYGIGFMGKEWDGFSPAALAVKMADYRHIDHKAQTARSASQHAGNSYDRSLDGNRRFGQWCEEWSRAAYRVARPSAYLLAFGGTRTVHRMTCALEDAGWIIRDMLVWVYLSGFPKSRASLKPSYEPIILARKPGPLRDLDIDGCRIPHDRPGPAAINVGERPEPIAPEGRWPANVVMVEPALGDASRVFLIPKAARSDREPVLGGLPERKADVGDDRPSGTFNERLGQRADGSWRTAPVRANVHPTVKPVDLMRHLVRLVTPTGGTVLDPFLGSGTTALAAEMEGFEWIGIEREAEYVAIAEARLNGTQKGMAL